MLLEPMASGSCGNSNFKGEIAAAILSRRLTRFWIISTHPWSGNKRRAARQEDILKSSRRQIRQELRQIHGTGPSLSSWQFGLHRMIDLGFYWISEGLHRDVSWVFPSRSELHLCAFLNVTYPTQFPDSLRLGKSDVHFPRRRVPATYSLTEQ